MADDVARQKALDISQSFIVQAPAGSGKTGLLTQRFLKLLAHVQAEPEEILAITFTRKAAQEMRSRILMALEAVDLYYSHKNQEQLETSKKNEENEFLRYYQNVSEHEQQTLTWAHIVYQRDLQKGWNLLKQPFRLKIMTIDSLCAFLTQQMPVSSRLGGVTQITEQARWFYCQTIEEVLLDLEDSDFLMEILQEILLHLDNDHHRFINLFSDMLAKREQWLPLVVAPNMRETLENAWRHLNIEKLQKLKLFFKKIPISVQNVLLELIQYAKNNLILNQKKHDLLLCFFDEINQFSFEIESLSSWKGLSSWLLKISKEPELRKSFRISEGFPPISKQSKSEKEKTKNYIDKLNEILENLKEQGEFLKCLKEIEFSPPLIFQDQQWSIIEKLIKVLPFLVAKLHVLFKEKQVSDFTEVSLSALQALGSSDEPTDLALKMDYQFNHILVDEFQDTSVIQFELLKRLTLGWHPDDGRTLFLVGDPMQSIYRFRKAEVGLFLQAKKMGINDIHLNFLQLTRNFRSQKKIVDWVNQLFTTVMPVSEDLNTGAIKYTSSVATQDELPDTIHFVATYNQAESMAVQLYNVIQHLKVNDPQGTIAILVQSRRHLEALLILLKKNKLSFRATEIERLSEHQIIQDLITITRVLWHLGDRAAWLALLRAPWCGLTSQDLLCIAQLSLDKTIWEVLLDLVSRQLNFCYLNEEGNNFLEIDYEDRHNDLEASILQNIGDCNQDVELKFTDLTKLDRTEIEENIASFENSENFRSQNKIKKQKLSQDGYHRICVFFPILKLAMEKRGRISTALLVEALWLDLQGPNCFDDVSEMENAESYFDLLRELEKDGLEGNVQELQIRLSALNASRHALENNAIELMTIHKAKGLEFDHVILPALERKTRNESHSLLLWQERLSHPYGHELLIAPIKKYKNEPFYDFLREQENLKRKNELLRLFYVATTRAKKSLWLQANLQQTDEVQASPHLYTTPLKKPSAGSLLAEIWSLTENDWFESLKKNYFKPTEISNNSEDVTMKSIFNENVTNPIAWPLKKNQLLRLEQLELEAKHIMALDMTLSSDELTFTTSKNTPLKHLYYQSPKERWLGTFLHQILQNWPIQQELKQFSWLNRYFLMKGLDETEAYEAAAKVLKALLHLEQDPKAQWLMQSHQDDCREWSLVTLIDGESKQIILDRSFIDNGVHWIIDYKTSEPKANQSLDNFILKERERYQAQLLQYAKAVQHYSSYPIKLALYYPLIPYFDEW